MEKTVIKQIQASTTKDYSIAQEQLRIFDKTEKFAVLTTESDGQPYISLIPFALTPDAEGIVFASQRTARKSRNVLANRPVALLVDNRSISSDCMNIESVIVFGTANSVMRGKKWFELSTLLIAKHPMLAEVTRSPTTSLIYVRAISYIHRGKLSTVL